MRFTGLRSSTYCLVFLAAPILAQAPTTAPAPADPDTFMRQAAEANSILSADMKPWHLRLKFAGIKQGTLPAHESEEEIWWASRDKYKVVYMSDGATRTEYRAGNESFYIGSEKGGYFGQNMVFHPLPYALLLDKETFSKKEVTVTPDEKLNCYTPSFKDIGPKLALTTTYCFDSSEPILRMSLDSLGNRTTWDNTVRVNGHYLAKLVTLSTKQQDNSATFAIEQFDPQLGVEESELASPADAKPFTRQVPVSPVVMAGRKISGDDPMYPLMAKFSGVYGSVVLSATISKDGTIKDLKVVSGPRELQGAATKAVKTWRFKPYSMEGGDTEEVTTTIDIVFNLNR